MTTTTLHAFADVHPTLRFRKRRSAAALAAGFLFIAITSTASDALMRALGVFPSDPAQPLTDALFAVAAAYRALFGVAGTYLAARLAPSRPVAHAWALGLVGVVLSTVGAFVMWNAGTHWYALVNVAIPFPAAFIGGRIRAAQLQ